MSDTTERANRAQQLLDDPVMAEALAGLERDALDQALAAKTYDLNEAIWALSNLKAAHAVRAQLVSLITTGKSEERARPAVA